MSPLLMGLLGVMLVPLFVANWRSSLIGLSLQGLLIGWAAYRLDPSLRTVDAWLSLVDLVLVRGVIAPLLLLRWMSSRRASARRDIAPPNLLSWTIALGLVLAAFNMAGTLVPTDGDQRALTSVAAAGVLLGLLVLASQTSPFGQVVGALRFENAIALFELGASHGHENVLLHAGQVAVVAATVAIYILLVRGMSDSANLSPPADEPTL